MIDGARDQPLLVESYFYLIKNILQNLLQRSSVLKNVKKIYSETINSGRYYDQWSENGPPVLSKIFVTSLHY